MGKERGQNEINRHVVHCGLNLRTEKTRVMQKKRCQLLSKQIIYNLVDILSETYSNITYQLFFNCSSVVVDR